MIKGAENSRPGREGVFQTPVTYASNTPAGDFFGLGNEQECNAKRMLFRQNAEKQAAVCKQDVGDLARRLRRLQIRADRPCRGR